MSEFKFSCPHCGQHIQCDEEYSGQPISCPECKQPFVVPPAPPTAATSAPRMSIAPGTPPPVSPAPRPQPADRPERCTLALVSLILSLVGLNLPAIVCGHIARSRIKTNPLLTGKGMALAALIIGYISLTACIAVAIAVSSFAPQFKEAIRQASRQAKVGQVDNTPAVDTPSLSGQEIISKVSKQLQGFNSLSGMAKSEIHIDMSGAEAQNIPVPDGAKKTKDPKKDLKQTSQGSQDIVMEADFKLGRPDLYRLDMNQEVSVMGRAITNKTTAWSAGDGFFMLLPGGKKYMKFETKDAAVAASAGLLGGVGITGMFFDDNNNMANYLGKSVRSKDEDVDGESCYVVKSTAMGQAVTIWIKKDSYLIKKQRFDFGGSISDVSDQDLEKGLTSSGRAATPDQQAKMKETMQGMKSMLSKMKGYLETTYSNIETNRTFAKKAFQVELPVDATLLPMPAPGGTKAGSTSTTTKSSKKGKMRK